MDVLPTGPAQSGTGIIRCLYHPVVSAAGHNLRDESFACGAARGQSGRIGKKGDSGSGLVFFISTTGSVIGVWVTAFLFIPNITNFKSALIHGLTLALISLVAGLRSTTIPGIKKSSLLLTALTGLLLCGGLLIFATAYLHKDETIAHNNYLWKIEAARDFFKFDPRRVTLYQMDARTYVKQCRHPYHMIIVDLFQGDGVPDYLVSRNFFHDLKNCIGSDGAVILNTFTIPKHMSSYYYLLKTLNAEFAQLYMFHDEFSNPDETAGIYLIAANNEYRPRVNLSMQNIPIFIQNKLQRIFSKVRGIDQDMLAGSRIITDERNIFPIVNIETILDTVERRYT